MTQAPPERHTGRTAVELAAAARAVQLAIRARLLRDVTLLWPTLDPKRLDETWPGWIAAMRTLVRNYHGQSSAAAASVYREARQRATLSPAPRSLVRLAPEPNPEWMDRAFGYSGPGLMERDTARPNTALSTTLGTASRIVADGGRRTTIDTVAADPVAVGYRWRTDGDPCYLCAILSARGIVYGESSFESSTPRFLEPKHPLEHLAGEIPSRAHNHCGCVLTPEFSRTRTLDPIEREALDVYKNRGPGDALTAFRKAWNERHKTP